MASTTHDIPGTIDGPGARGDQAAGGVHEKAQTAAEPAQEKAQAAADTLQARLREQIAQGSAKAADQINTQTADLRAVSESLREQGKDGPADVADRIAGYAQRVGDYLHEKDADTLLSDAEDLGRRKPWAATAGGLALGFAASRFLKASSRQRYQTRTQQSSWSGASAPQRTASPAPYESRLPEVGYTATGQSGSSVTSPRPDPNEADVQGRTGGTGL